MSSSRLRRSAFLICAVSLLSLAWPAAAQRATDVPLTCVAHTAEGNCVACSAPVKIDSNRLPTEWRQYVCSDLKGPGTRKFVITGTVYTEATPIGRHSNVFIESGTVGANKTIHEFKIYIPKNYFPSSDDPGIARKIPVLIHAETKAGVAGLLLRLRQCQASRPDEVPPCFAAFEGTILMSQK